MITRKRITDIVKAKMEEVTPFDEGLAILSSQVKPITTYIEESIQPSLDELLMICPLHLTEPKTLPVTSTGDNAKFTSKTVLKRQVGVLSLPEDFIRLHTFKMEGWERPVHRPISIENPQYKEQSNRWGRGGNAKPVIAKVSNKLEIYTFDEGAVPETHLYVARIDAEDDNIDINQLLVDPLCSLIAANVFSIFGSEQQNVMMKQVDNALKLQV